MVAVKTGLSKNELTVNVSDNNLNLTITSVDAGKARLQIFDSNGKRLVNKDLSLETGLNTVKTSVNDFATGVYVVQLTVGTQVLSKKFIK